LGTIFDKRNSAINGFRICRNEPGTSTYEFFASWNSGTTNLVCRWTRPSTGAWNHWVITYDSSAHANNCVVYQNGSSVSVSRFGTGPTSGTADTNSDPHCVGDYNISPYTRAWDGMLAEWATWDVILDAGEAASLGKGYSPMLIRPASLKDYVPMVRDNVSLKLTAPTITGALVQPHPRIIMPHRRQNRRFTTAAAGSVPMGAYARNSRHFIGAGVF
jgi:hypothetical protein